MYIGKNSIFRSNLKHSVSFIMVVYNQEKYLYTALKSLENQTLKEIEFICIDDGSTDKSSEILHDLADNNKQ